MIKNKVNYRSNIKQCFLCRSASDTLLSLCQSCLNDMPWLGNHCKRCALPLISPDRSDLLCAECIQHPPAYQQVIAPLRYAFPVDQMIRTVKDHRQPHLLSDLAAILEHYTELPKADYLVPVPMHPSQERKRGFNQAELIAKKISKLTHLPLKTDLLYRTDERQQQRQLNRRQRLKANRDSFSCSPCTADRILLVDDVMTTGATLDICSQLLLKNGANEVICLVIARTAKH